MLAYMLALLSKHTKTALVYISIWVNFFSTILWCLLLILYIVRADIFLEVLFASLLHSFDQQSLLAASCLDPFLRGLVRLQSLDCRLRTSLLRWQACPGACGLWEPRMSIGRVHKVLHLFRVMQDAQLSLRPRS